MRNTVRLGMLAVLLPVAALAQSAPAKLDIKDAASLIGKTIDEDTQYAAGTDAQRLTAGAWTYGFAFDDPGLQRAASTKDLGKGETLLATAVAYNRRCRRTDKAVSFTFNGDERFSLKGSVAQGRRADAWVYFGNAANFEPKPLKVTMAFSENDGALHLKLDPAEIARYAKLALCSTATAPDGSSDRCAIFSLSGFVRAYDFVCDAK